MTFGHLLFKKFSPAFLPGFLDAGILPPVHLVKRQNRRSPIADAEMKATGLFL